LAALELTEEARILLDEGRTGDAIRLLERAVNLHPDSGRSYYYLAEAWIARGDLRQADEFNGLAEAYGDGGREWRTKVRRQKERIAKGSGP
jgi:predicted Zn-dependent protease